MPVCIGGSRDGVRVRGDRPSISVVVTPPPLSLVEADRLGGDRPFALSFQREDYYLRRFVVGKEIVLAYVLSGLDTKSPIVLDRVYKECHATPDHPA